MKVKRKIERKILHTFKFFKREGKKGEREKENRNKALCVI